MTGSAGSTVGWLDYFDEMIDWGESQTPFMKFFAPIDTADNDATYGLAEAGTAAVSSNGRGVIDGFGSQGLSLLDYMNGCALSTSDWCTSFGTYYQNASPLELQQISLSDEQDGNCSTQSPPPLNACGTPPRDSGDLRVWLPFAVSNHVSVIELYYLDAALAFDPNYCTSIIGGLCSGYSIGTNTFLTQTLQATFMNDVGQGSTTGVNNCPLGTTGAGGASTGNCAYANAINAAHGPHMP